MQWVCLKITMGSVQHAIVHARVVHDIQYFQLISVLLFWDAITAYKTVYIVFFFGFVFVLLFLIFLISYFLFIYLLLR